MSARNTQVGVNMRVSNIDQLLDPTIKNKTQVCDDMLSWGSTRHLMPNTVTSIRSQGGTIRHPSAA